MITKICSTEDFWEEMCSIYFIRTGINTGENYRTGFKFVVKTPPEDVDCFISKKVSEALKGLR